ncbi:MAG: S8 family serine peptidase [Promethearchaeota archaeon]
MALVHAMFEYIDSPYPYYEPRPEKKSSSLRIIAIMIIVMLVASGGLFLLLPIGDLIPGPQEPIKVAIIDSGIDSDFTIEGRMGAEQSFVLPQYGYPLAETAVSDSKPDGSQHGTIVAKAVAANSANAVILNAKVLASTGIATTGAVVAAIYWAVDQNCSVINLSLGATPGVGDPIEQAVEYAFNRGVVVVAAAGNEGDNGLAGNTINTPGVFEHVLSVGGLDIFGEPADYTSYGPTSARYMKPDLCAPGYFDSGNSRYFGTSFATPRVAAAAAELMAHSIRNNVTYTPGAIMTALLKGADPLEHPEYVVGAGKLNLETSKSLMFSTLVEGGLPAISYAHPRTLPLDFERLFYGDNYTFDIKLLTAGYTTFDIDVTANALGVFDMPGQVTINQTGAVPLNIYVPDSGLSSYQATIEFISDDFGSTTLDVQFGASVAAARVAFDISFTTWWMDTTYGQFRDFYRVLTQNDISVTEIRDESETDLAYLQLFDAVVLLDPFVWDDNETDPLDSVIFSMPFAQETKQAYQDYYDSGGGLFVTGLSNASLDVAKLNDFIDWTGYSLSSTLVSDGNNPVEATQVTAHIITSGVGSFDYLGAAVIEPPGATTLGRYGGNVLLSVLEDAGGGRLVVTGTNYFIDNWGINGDYSSTSNDRLSLRIVQWLVGLL